MHYKLFQLENLSHSERIVKEKNYAPSRARTQQLNNVDIRATLNALIQAYDNAADSKIVTKTKHLRRPLDMLENGCLGPEIAHLFNTIRLSYAELKSFCNS